MDELRRILESALGEVFSLEEEAPGVYSFVIPEEEKSYDTEYYLVEQGSEIISDQAKTYGTPVEGHPELLLYVIGEVEGGYQIVWYEIVRYQLRENPTPEALTDLHTTASFGMESHPEYFGEYPAPIYTPRGRTMRYKKLWNGIWCLETDQGERMVAFCYPAWNAELRSEVRPYGEFTQQDLDCGVNNVCAYLFFPWETSCIPLYEWLDFHPTCREHELLNYDALKNVLCHKYTGYALQANEDARERKEQFAAQGMDTAGMSDKPLACVPGAGFDFLKF